MHRSGIVVLGASVAGAVLARMFGYGDDLWDTVGLVLPVAGAVVASRHGREPGGGPRWCSRCPSSRC
ncbi:hypothetical protein [Actinophytocola sp.]|uniref:hypothetical protein n=1 Tax=Actinophytocola sp. TaxID=1872138 RepID=UPI002D3ED44C|nr:hypothetical protein [Actinophytocola sp.]HYQ64051.1 hypothetical protein [Actinophytocola sp.]